MNKIKFLLFISTFIIKATDELRIFNYNKTIEFIKKLIIKNKKDIDLKLIYKIHKNLFKNTNEKKAGKLRKTILIHEKGYEFSEPQELPKLLDQFLFWLHNTNESGIKLATEAHMKFIKIHPFFDGNGRTARILMNLILQQEGFSTINIDEKNREAYNIAVEKSLEQKNNKFFYDFICNLII